MGTFEPSNIANSKYIRWTSQKGLVGVAKGEDLKPWKA
jgi:hypothetical protein